MACFVESRARPNQHHQLWVERDESENIVTFDCPQCDYWEVVQGRPSNAQLKTMQLVALRQLQAQPCTQ